MNRYSRTCTATAALALLLAADWAAAASWPALRDTYFAGKQLDAAPFIHISAPARAASGEQVPLAFRIDQPARDDPIKEKRRIVAVSVFVDANPVPLTAVFRFQPDGAPIDIATRIRFDVDSPVHLVAEAADGKLYVAEVMVKASGGCGGSVAGDDPAVLAAAGKMKLALDGPLRRGAVNKARLLIRHPMHTGLQRDLSTNGFRPAFYIDRIAVSYRGKPVLAADTSIGISENPLLEFGFMAEGPGVLEVVLRDNHGATFRQSLDTGG